MTGLARAQRRKATTYGRSSRKAIVAAGNAFAEIAAIDIWGTEAKVSDDKHNSAPIRRDHPRELASDARLESSRGRVARVSPQARIHEQKNPSIQQHRSTSTFSDRVFDVRSSEDEDDVKVSAPRKRRKITPSAVVDDIPYVYDDASLQKHVAAEVFSEARGMQHRTPAERRDEAENVRHGCNQGVHAHEGSERDRKAKHRASPSRGAGRQTKRSTSPKPSGLPTQKAKMGLSSRVIRPTTPELAANAARVYRSGGVRAGSGSSTKDAYPPTTPPRSTETPAGATTPRQRELWNRLLEDDTHPASPSNLDLPGLLLTNKMHKKPEAPLTARKVTWEKAQDMAPNSRPRRLVDTLNFMANGPSSRHAIDSDDGSESASSDDQSSYYQSETSAANGAVTVQTSPSADSQSRPQQTQEQLPSHPSQALPLLHGIGLKVTYARQRSYLTEDDLNEAAMLSVPVIPEPMTRHGAKRKGLGHRAPISQSTQIYDEDFEDIQDSQSGAMRSIHELREAGGNVRLVSELEAMLDDIDDQKPISATLRRTRLTDLVSKLLDPTNCRLFIDQGFESRLLARVGFDDDLIAGSLFAAAMLQLLIGPSSTPLLAQISDVRVVKFLILLLGNDQDLKSTVKLRQYNLSKFGQLEYRTLCDSLLKSTGWRAGKPTFLSCHVLALQCLEYLVRQTREAGSLSEILSAVAMSRITTTSIPSFSTPPPTPTTLSSVSLELAVSILESCTISNAAECQGSLSAGETLERIIGLLPLLASWKQEQYSTSETLTLRLYLNLTNNNPGLCEDFSTPGVTTVLFKSITTDFDQLKGPKCDRVLVLDHLILSLGSFINLAESSEAVRRLVWKLQYDSQSYLDVLLELYITKSKRASEVRPLMPRNNR